MKDELISFETAKLASSKEFNIKTKSGYWFNSKFNNDGDKIDCIRPASEINDLEKYYNFQIGHPFVYAPTQSLLQRWLREVHKINIIINFCDDDTWEASLQTDDFPEKESDKDIPEFCTYEDCLEYALKEALKLL